MDFQVIPLLLSIPPAPTPTPLFVFKVGTTKNGYPALTSIIIIIIIRFQSNVNKNESPGSDLKSLDLSSKTRAQISEMLSCTAGMQGDTYCR